MLLRKTSLSLLLTILSSAATAAPEIRLVLQITVDQLRGDLPLRHMQQFDKGGFQVPDSAKASGIPTRPTATPTPKPS